MGLIFSDKGL